MVGVTLVEIRQHIESLASDAGDFSLLCARTGERPFPASGKRFADRATAAAAARATEQYRATLRRYDPRLPAHDVIVREETGAVGLDAGDGSAPDPATDWSLSTPVVTNRATSRSSADLVEFCHGVAASVFEALSARGHETVESAVMDAYLDLAESVSHPDRLCLCLLESMAAELHAGLAPAEQAATCARAARRLQPVESREEATVATFAHLQRLGLVGACQRLSVPDGTAGHEALDVTLADYALSPRNGRLPVLPIVVDLHRRRPQSPPSLVRARPAPEGWRMRVVLGSTIAPEGLATVPVHDG